jgi:asparagine synthase (glutamine-hydrolysing)
MTQVQLVKNDGYKWIISDGVFFKGYFQYLNGDNTVFLNMSAINEIGSIDSLEAFIAFLKRIDGSYAVVIQKDGYTFAAVDRARSIALYYHTGGGVVSDSSEYIREHTGIEKQDVEPDAFLELFATDYIIGNDTVYTEIKQLDIGQAAGISADSIELKYYFYHISAIDKQSDDELKRTLTETANKTFERFAKVINARPVVLSMSGGYDSRFVGCMLKRVGIEDVSCYTYGKPDSFEVRQSKKNADALGYRWACVEHTDERIKAILYDENKPYFEMCREHDYTIFLQNFFAVKHLHENGWFKPLSVFITGMCGDMPTGNYVKRPSEFVNYEFNSQRAAEKIYSDLFTRYQLDDKYKTEFVNKLRARLDALPITISDYQSYTTAVDCLTTGFIHSRAYLHMNRVHEYFGYEWLLPYWDVRLLQKWYSIPAEKRAGQALYEDWLLADICAPFGIANKKYRAVYSNNLLKKKLMYFGGGIAACVLYNMGLPFRRRYDYSNFAPLEIELFKRFNSQKAIKYSKAGLPLLLNRYILQERYGNKAIMDAWKRIVK